MIKKIILLGCLIFTTSYAIGDITYCDSEALTVFATIIKEDEGYEPALWGCYISDEHCLIEMASVKSANREIFKFYYETNRMGYTNYINYEVIVDNSCKLISYERFY